MARTRRARHFTPPPDLFSNTGQFLTLQRAGVVYGKLYGQALGKAIPCSLVEEVTQIPPRTQSHILSTNHVRTLHHAEDKGPDPRGRPRGLSRDDTAKNQNLSKVSLSWILFLCGET